MLTQEGLRDSVTLTTSGGIQTGLDSFKAILLGADRIELGTQVLVALGCTMAEVCHKGTCPVGIATTNQELIDAKYKGTPLQLVRAAIGDRVALSRNSPPSGSGTHHGRHSQIAGALPLALRL